MFTLDNSIRMGEIFHIKSISDMHDVFGLAKPKHPLVSIIRFKNAQIKLEYHHVRCALGMYCIIRSYITDYV